MSFEYFLSLYQINLLPEISKKISCYNRSTYLHYKFWPCHKLHTSLSSYYKRYGNLRKKKSRTGWGRSGKPNVKFSINYQAMVKIISIVYPALTLPPPRSCSNQGPDLTGLPTSRLCQLHILLPNLPTVQRVLNRPKMKSALSPTLQRLHAAAHNFKLIVTPKPEAVGVSLTSPTPTSSVNPRDSPFPVWFCAFSSFQSPCFHSLF